MRRSLPPILCLGALCLAALVAASAQEMPADPDWERDALLVYSDNAAEFARLRAAGPRDRRLVEYMDALDALHAGEAVARNVARARKQLTLLAASDPDDSIGLASRFYLARIAHLHSEPADLGEARRLYLELFEGNKDRFFGQLAYLKYLTIAIYDEEGDARGPLARIREVEQRAPEITIPSLSQNFHRMIGDAYMAYAIEPQKALERYEAALAIGIGIEPMKLEVMEQAARLCEQLGRRDRAAHWRAELARASQVSL